MLAGIGVLAPISLRLQPATELGELEGQGEPNHRTLQHRFSLRNGVIAVGSRVPQALAASLAAMQ